MVPNRRQAFALTLSVWALLAMPAVAATSSPEAGRYSFKTFLPEAGDPRIPVELRAHAPRSPLPPELLADDRAVEIEWVSREGPGLRGYRLTATIDGGPLSGLTAQWTVAPGSGEPGPPSAPRTYRLNLPLPVDGHLRVHAALEAVREDGSAVVLAVRHATPVRRAGERGLCGRGWRGEWPAPGPVATLTSSAATLLSLGGIGVPNIGPGRVRAFIRAAASADADRPGRPRGPPAAC